MTPSCDPIHSNIVRVKGGELRVIKDIFSDLFFLRAFGLISETFEWISQLAGTVEYTDCFSAEG